MLQRLIYAGLGFLYPPHCLLCQTALDRPGLCTTCVTQAGCSEEVEAISLVIEDTQVFVLREFNESVRQLVHMLKYQGKTLPGRLWGHALGRGLGCHLVGVDNWIVVPVPLHRARQRERGYNQSAVIAEALAKEMGCVVLNSLLKRVRHTPSQTHLTKQARKENVAAAFVVCEPHKVCGNSVVLVDDVITTGATSLACVEALMGAGAKRVVVAAVTRPELGDDAI